MRRTLAALTALWAMLGCAGHYEVGAMDAPAAGGTTGGESQTSGAGNLPMMVAMGMGATGTAGPSMPASECLTTEAPSALEGDFAEPSLVWSRIQTLIWGREHEPPRALPDTTSYEWAADVGLLGLRQALAESGGVPGSVPFIIDWFHLDKDAALFSQHYAALLSNENNVVLEHVLPGMLTEPSWLALHTSISSRAAAISWSLLGRAMPTAPEMAHDVVLDAELQDREALTAILKGKLPCEGCHQMFDSLGYALGSFDSMGRYRDLDHGQPLDLSGSFTLPVSAGSIAFDGLADFAAKLGASCDATLAVADAFLRYALAVNGVADDEAETLFEANRSRFRQAFVQGGRTYPALVQAYAQSPLGIRP
jgi:hypothetical protein